MLQREWTGKKFFMGVWQANIIHSGSYLIASGNVGLRGSKHALVHPATRSVSIIRNNKVLQEKSAATKLLAACLLSPLPFPFPCHDMAEKRVTGQQELLADVSIYLSLILPRLVKSTVFLQFDKYYVCVRISYVFADVLMRFHPNNTPRFNVNLLLSTIRKCQTPLERRLRVQYVVRVSVL